MDAARLRAAFPVLQRTAYLNAGTCGPLAAAAVQAGQDAERLALEEGRATAYYGRLMDLRQRLRAAYAAVLGGRAEDVALTTGTSEGLVTVLLGLPLGEGDEVLTSQTEHPGLLGPLIAARERLGITVRTAPLAELPEAVGPRTRLVACSHVDWTSGAIAPTAGLAGLDVPVLLDGAQGVGAVDVDVEGLGCDFYAGSGQKWMCGPVGTGMLWVSPAWRERLVATGPTYVALADPSAGLGARLRDDAGRFDTPAMSLATVATALAAHDLLADAGWPEVRARAREQAAWLADRLADAGRVVAPRAATTLVSWELDEPVARVEALAAAGVVVRSLPGTPYVRASVGAWNDEDDLDRLLAAIAP
ncbi:MAG TPA: aminotransferase class V-fold PLP-dependent enzyme [Baekduia sp.]|nr:aminotransferase class V-fold PLP-dependent enzyme [Baekduia sp.]